MSFLGVLRSNSRPTKKPGSTVAQKRCAVARQHPTTKPPNQAIPKDMPLPANSPASTPRQAGQLID